MSRNAPGTRRPPRAIRVVGLMVLTVGLGIALLFTWGAGEIYEAVSRRDGIYRVDRPLLDWVLTWRTSSIAHDVTLFTDLGGPVIMPVIAVVGAVALAVWWRSVVPLIVMAVAAAGSVAMTIISKPLVGRTRPPLVDAVPPYELSASFPSGHSLNAMVIIGALIYLFVIRQRRWWLDLLVGFLGVVFVLGMGLSRVLLGHHWLTDVLAGWLLGLGWLFVVITGHRLVLVPTFVRDHLETSAVPARPGEVDGRE